MNPDSQHFLGDGICLAFLYRIDSSIYKCGIPLKQQTLTNLGTVVNISGFFSDILNKIIAQRR